MSPRNMYTYIETGDGLKSSVYRYSPSSHPSRPYDECTLPSTVEYQSLITFLDSVVPHSPVARNRKPLKVLLASLSLVPSRVWSGHIEGTHSIPKRGGAHREHV